jgi:ADP-heptose:LPS heptosyltransferase
MNGWPHCKNVLVIRPDNLGDLLMSSPAIRAIKETFGCRITVLTSAMASGIAGLMADVDEVITCNLPWVKNDGAEGGEELLRLMRQLKGQAFDAAIIFTVYSQNPMPSILLAYMAGVPLRLAYCRENPYGLLTHWVPDAEPYSFIQHQVRRDLSLVAAIGAHTGDDRLLLPVNEQLHGAVLRKLAAAGIDTEKPWIVFGAGVSEEKRRYPEGLWIKTGRKLVKDHSFQLVLTGLAHEQDGIGSLAKNIGPGAFCVAGLFALAQFIELIRLSSLVVSVNTGTAHIAAATGTPVVVLYALTNPQHAPWKVRGKVLLFDVPQTARSKNEVVKFANQQWQPQGVGMIDPDEIVAAVQQTLSPLGHDDLIPEMIPLRNAFDQAL